MFISKTLSHVWQHQVQVHSGRGKTSSTSVPLFDPQSHAPQFRYDPPQELVWRRAAQAPVRSENANTEPAMIGAKSRTQIRPQPVLEPESVTVAATEPALATQVSKIDPAILDRITNSVIDQVEKRIRIERERRGL